MSSSAAPFPSPPEAGSAGRRVLLVEDDLVSASALSSILTRRGYRVAHATTVADGLAGLAAAPDAVILDLMLPDGDGAAVLRHVRSAGLAATRVIVTTAVHDPARLADVQALRPDVLLPKPINLASLFQTLPPPTPPH